MDKYFIYDDAHTDYLRQADPLMSRLIDYYGRIDRSMQPDPFCALIHSIISQQISGKAADGIWRRLIEKAGNITPQSLFALTDEDITSCGIGPRKLSYIKGAVGISQNGDVDFDNLSPLSDREIISQLTSLKGVGVWTAEMLLIFALNRMDVLSFNDYGIKSGIKKLYGLSDISKSQFEQYRSIYSPYGSVASLYLWALGNDSIDRLPDFGTSAAATSL